MICIISVSVLALVVLGIVMDTFRIKKNDICKQLHDLRLTQDSFKEQIEAFKDHHDACKKELDQHIVQLFLESERMDRNISRTIGNEMEAVRLRIDDELNTNNKALDQQVDLKKIYKRLEKLEGRSDCKHSKLSDHKLFKSRLNAIETIQSSFVEDINSLSERIQKIDEAVKR